MGARNSLGLCIRSIGCLEDFNNTPFHGRKIRANQQVRHEFHGANKRHQLNKKRRKIGKRKSYDVGKILIIGATALFILLQEEIIG